MAAVPRQATRLPRIGATCISCLVLLAALAAVALVEGVPVAGFVTVFRRPDGSFGDLLWTSLTPPVSGSAAFADSVYGNAVVGIAPTSGAVNAYQAVVVPSSG